MPRRGGRLGEDRLREFYTGLDGVREGASQGYPTYFPVLIAPSILSHDPNAHRYCINHAQWPEIRERARQTSFRKLAAVYGVSHETIRRIVRGASQGRNG